MNRNELVERIRDALLDPWNDPDDYYDLAPITVEYAKDLLADLRETEQLAELDEDERLPEETTPADLQEVMNCIIRWREHEHQVKKLADWLTATENVCIYDQYRDCYENNSPEIYPVDWLYNESTFPFELAIANAHADVISMLTIGKNSASTFNPNHEYCWFDKGKWQLFSSDTPFADGIVDAEALARYAHESGDKEILNEIASQMDADLWDEIFPGR